MLKILYIFNSFVSDFQIIILSLTFGYIVYYFSRFLWKIYSLPAGPLPLPIVGNLLLFRGTKTHQSYQLIELSKKYGPIFTLWMGPNPFVFILDFDLAKEAFSRSELSGRADSFFGKLVSNEKHSDILFADFGPQWLSLRRVAHLAVRKYSVNDKLAHLVSDVVDHTIKLIINKEGLNNSFNPYDYIYHLFLNIKAASVFGKRYELEDPEFKKFKYIFQDFFKEFSTRLTIIEFIPIMRFIDRNIVKKRVEYIEETKNLMKNKFISHYKDFNESITRDFCDSLILAKNDALAEGKESAQYLNDDNLTMVLWDLFIAGIDTTHNTFKWLLLLLANDQNFQQKLRQEIETNIGDRMPVQEDRNSCHYVMAFISETLRYRLVVPLGMFHKAMVDTKIGEHKIPVGTGIFLHHSSILHDNKHWSNPDQFIPERFLEKGRYLSQRPNAFIPFGSGRRVCLGEKLAMVELFLVLVRFLQITSDYDIKLEGEADLEAIPLHIEIVIPKNYKIYFESKN